MTTPDHLTEKMELLLPEVTAAAVLTSPVTLDGHELLIAGDPVVILISDAHHYVLPAPVATDLGMRLIAQSHLAVQLATGTVTLPPSASELAVPSHGYL